MLRWTLPSRNSAFWLDRNLAILASVRGGWAAHLGNVGLKLLDRHPELVNEMHTPTAAP